tara:strand:- start:33 stop:239 length:207 start_codon:yes stop_codon:yes gene_type:complete
MLKRIIHLTVLESGFLLRFLWIFTIGIMKDKHAFGQCINTVVRIWKLEVAFSVGTRTAEPVLEVAGEA